MDLSVYKKMPSPKIGSESKYPDDFRKKVAEDYLLTDMSCKELLNLKVKHDQGIKKSVKNEY